MKAAGRVPEFPEQLQAGAVFGPENVNPGVTDGAGEVAPRPTTWIKVLIPGDANTYWMPLYKVNPG